MHILHNTIYNKGNNDDRKHRPANPPKNEGRQPRIRNRMPTRPTGRSSKTNTLHSNSLLKRTRTSTRTLPAPAKSRNMQKPHTAALDRRLVLIPTWARRSPQRNGTQRLPLRPHSSSPRTSRPHERRTTNKRRKTTTLPLRPKTSTKKIKHF